MNMATVIALKIDCLKAGDIVTGIHGTQFEIVAPARNVITALPRILAEIKDGEDAGEKMFLFAEEINFTKGIKRAFKPVLRIV